MPRLLTRRGWPLLPQLAVAAALVAVVAALALGPANPELNPGMWLLWSLWWPLLLLSFIPAGRLWCAVCPVSLLGGGADRAFPGRPAFPPFLARGGAALLVVSFSGIHLANLWFQFEEEVRATGLLLAALGGAAALLTLAFPGRRWCRTLCPIGAAAQALAGLSPLRIADPGGACPRPCPGTTCEAGPAGTPCPVGINLRSGIDPGACILCGDCLKACPRLGDLRWEVRRPDRATAAPAAPEALAALALLGLAVDMALTHLVEWPILFWELSSALGVAAGPGSEMALHAAIIGGLPLAGWLLARPIRRRGAREARLAALAAPARSLAGAALLALALRPLLVDGPVHLQRLLLVAGWEGAELLRAFRQLDGLPLLVLQEGTVTGGLVLAWGARAGHGTRSGTRRLMVAAAGALLLWIYSRPMLG